MRLLGALALALALALLGLSIPKEPLTQADMIQAYELYRGRPADQLVPYEP